MRNEPVLSVAAVMAFVQSVIMWLSVSGRLTWTDAESAAFMTMLEAGMPYILTIGNLVIGALVARWQVVPEAKVEQILRDVRSDGGQR